MGIESQIEGLEQLVAVDAQIKALRDELAKERNDIDALSTEKQRLEAQLATDRASLTEMDKTRGELTQDHRHLGQQLDRSRERLSRARTERESQAAERELDELRKLHRDREVEVSKLVALCDEARNTILNHETRIAELSTRLDTSSPDAKSRMATLEADIAEKQVGRRQIGVKVGGLTVRRYDSMHARGKIPVARTTEGTCLGCYVQLPPMLFHSLLSRTQLGECPNCHRILYYSPPVAAGTPDEPLDASSTDA